jgi:hypothetical protein
MELDILEDNGNMQLEQISGLKILEFHIFQIL